MGGLGSGRWHRTNTRPVVEDLARLDVRQLHRGGFLTPGRQFSCRAGAAAMACETRADHLLLTEMGQAEFSAHRLILDRTPCNYGGSRPWFLCPGCGARAAVLYGLPPRFACRRCLGLAYHSQQLEPLMRLRLKTQRIRRRLGGPESPLEPFPDKPKGMRSRTYHRLIMAWHRAEVTICGIADGWSARSRARLNRLETAAGIK